MARLFSLTFGFLLGLLTTGAQATTTTDPWVPTGTELLKALAQAQAFTGNPPTVVKEVHALLEEEGLPVVQAKFTLAASRSNGPGACLVTYNHAPDPEFGVIFKRVPTVDRTAMMEAVWVHELTHCIEEMHAYVQPGLSNFLSPELLAYGVTFAVKDFKSYMHSPHETIWREALADIYAALFLHQNPRTRHLVPVLIETRTVMSEIDPEHNTANLLTAILPDLPESVLSENAYTLAQTLREKHQDLLFGRKFH